MLGIQEILVHFVRVIKRGNRLSRVKIVLYALFSSVIAKDQKKKRKKKSIDQFRLEIERSSRT